MAGPYGNAIPIEDGADVMRVDAFQHDRKHADLFASGPDQSQTWNCRQHFCPIHQQFSFVSGSAIESDLRDVLQCGTKSDRTGNMRRTRLELIWQFIKSRLFESDGTDHVAACLIRRHLVEQVLPAVQNTNACGAEDFVA